MIDHVILAFSLTVFALLFPSLTLVVLAGCSQQAGSERATQVAAESHEEHDPARGQGHDHGGWWCVEHGIPEAECSMCSARAAEEFKARGDWCEEHQRAESQCFKCDPSRAEKYARLYEAKFGHAPPKPTE